MKYRGARALSSSVAVWLEQQLEERGIDSLTYSRYIVNLIQNDSFDFCDSPKLNKGCSKKRIRNNWKNSDLELLKKSAVIECLKEASDQPSGIESLVEELYRKLKQAESEGDSYLKEKTNSGDIFNVDLPVSSPSSLALKYYSVFPALGVENSVGDCFFQNSIWNKAKCFSRRKDSEGSPKECRLSKRKESNKENACLRGRMRSRSTVKQATHHRNRAGMAKSLDRKDDEATPRLRSKHSELKTRKCLNFIGQDEMDVPSHLSRTPGRRDKFEEAIEFDHDLPVDFQQLLQSPDESSSTFFKQTSQRANPSHAHGNFIQCGTNITSSIWSEKMEDDTLPEIQESFPISWEPSLRGTEGFNSSKAGAKYVEWSDARNSLLSSAWKLPFAYGNLMESKKESLISDIEKTILNFGNEGSFYSFFGSNAPKISLSSTKTSDVSDGPCKSLLYNESPLKKVVPSVSGAADESCSGNQEEDLLTSMKTHFRPIKQDRCDPSALSDQKYIDGSTFVLSTSLEDVDFRRSESGSLYIGNNKYMEYKCPDQPPLQKSEFVPKFKVQQNEKFCQTDDTCFSEEGGCMEKEDDKCQFYFPGDDRLAEDMVNCVVDEEDSGVETTPITVSGWVTAWPISSCSGIWSHNSEGNSKPWIFDGVNCSGQENNDNGGEQYLRLRHELTEDGEELLSDLSSIHLFLDADRIEDPSPHIPCFSGMLPKNTRNPSLSIGRRKSFEQTVLLRPNQKERKRRHSSSSRQGYEKVGKHLLQSLTPIGIRPLSF